MSNTQDTRNQHVGQPANRVEGPAKVTGRAQYAAEFFAEGLVHGFVVSAGIANGTITAIDTAAALAVPGVHHVFTHENVKGLPWLNYKYTDEDSPPGKPFRPLYDNRVRFNMQPIALVVADNFELARYAAGLVQVTYDTAPNDANLLKNRGRAREPKKYKGNPPPKPRGDAKEALSAAEVKVKPEYHHAAEHHNPMEMHASTALWEDDGTLTVYDKTQGVQNSQQYICKIFGFSEKEVRVRSHYMGGGFGSGLRPQYQLFLTILAAKYLKRPVRVMLTRQQMFSFGHRPETGQLLALGASPNGQLQSMYHYVFAETSRFEDYAETVTDWSGVLYNCENAKFGHRLVDLDVYTPLDMRAPGAATGVPAIESAIDELAYALKMDPLELRLKNYAERDLNNDLPFSSKALRECYGQAAEAFGWKSRPLEPRSMREGRKLIGWGMANGIWEAQQVPASAKALYSLDGRLTVSSATSDIGTGTYTIMTQIAAETLGLPLDKVTFRLGDSSLPPSKLEGGSWTAASVGTAVKEVCTAVAEQLLSLASKMKNNPLQGAKLEELTFDDGLIRTAAGGEVAIADIMRAAGVYSIEETKKALPNMLKQRNYTRNTHSAIFVEVEVDEALGTLFVRRMVTAVAAGRILNPKTARSQVLGGMVWGIGMALHEKSMMDYQYGRFMNHNLSEYHVPVNADIGQLEVIFVEEQDTIVNPLGVKGLGEIGIVGVPAAISNAVFHATGKRIREWPLTLDKLL